MTWNEYVDAFTFTSSKIFGFTRNEQMGCSETFRCNKNGAKHPCNVKSHVDIPRNVSGENMTRLGEVKKSPKNNQS